MNEPKYIIFNADVKGVKLVHSRNVLQVTLEMDKAHLQAVGMREVHHDLVDCEASDNTYKVMLMEAEQAKEVAKRGEAKEEPKKPEVGKWSEGLPWRFTNNVKFARYFGDKWANIPLVDDNGAFEPKEVRNAVKDFFVVESTTELPQETIDDLITGFNEYLKKESHNG